MLTYATCERFFRSLVLPSLPLFAVYLCGRMLPWIFGIILSLGCVAAALSWEAQHRERAEAVVAERRRYQRERYNAQKEATYAEQCTWFNVLLLRVSIQHRQYLSKWLVGVLDPLLDWYRPKGVTEMKIGEFDLGSYPMHFESIEAFQYMEDETIQLDADVRWYTNSRGVLIVEGPTVGSIPVHINEITIDARTRFVFKLTEEWPWISCISLSFLERPWMDFELAPFNFFDLMRVPVLNTWLRGLVTDFSMEFMGNPSQWDIDMMPVLDIFTMPRRVLVNLREARGLGTGSPPDTYAVARVGDETRRTRLIAKSTTPYWDETFEFMIEDPSETYIVVEVYAKLPGAPMQILPDPLLGTGVISLKDELEKGSVMVTHVIPDAPEGYEFEPVKECPDVIANTAKWHRLAKSTVTGEVCVGVTLHRRQPGDEVGRSGVLTVTAIEAMDILPSRNLITGNASTVKPYLSLTVGGEKQTTPASTGTSPTWNATFQFFVRHADTQHLLVQAFDATRVGHDRPVGETTVAIDLISSQEFWMPLVNGGGDGQVRLFTKFAADVENESLAGSGVDTPQSTNSVVMSIDGGEGSTSSLVAATTVVEVLLENQRIGATRKWSSRHLIPKTDARAWCRPTELFSGVSKEEVDVSLPLGWVWAGDWAVYSEGADANGWKYAFDTPKLIKYAFVGKATRKHFVRRREWRRTRVFRPEQAAKDKLRDHAELAKVAMQVGERHLAAAAESVVTLTEESTAVSKRLWNRARGKGKSAVHAGDGHVYAQSLVESNTPPDHIVVEELTENERLAPTRSWTSSALIPKTDPKPWADISAPHTARTREAVELPVGWAWATPWRHETSNADFDGWSYAFDFHRLGINYSFSERKQLRHFVRRRIWWRVRVFKGDVEEALAASVDDIAPRQHSATLSSTGAVEMSGMLVKRSDTRHAWQERYCVIACGKAMFFRKHTDIKPSITINLAGCAIEPTSKKPHSFAIIKKGQGSKTYHLMTPSAAKTAEWMECLSNQASITAAERLRADSFYSEKSRESRDSKDDREEIPTTELSEEDEDASVG